VGSRGVASPSNRSTASSESAFKSTSSVGAGFAGNTGAMDDLTAAVPLMCSAISVAIWPIVRAHYHQVANVDGVRIYELRALAARNHAT